MSKTRPPAANPPQGKNNKPAAPTGSKPNKKRATRPEPGEKPGLSWQKKVLAGLAILVVAGLLVILASQPQELADRRALDQSMGTALAATGFTPPPTLVPGSDLGISLVIFGYKDYYYPSQPDEKINLVIANTRDKSFYISNCDGVVLQRFLGTDSTDKTQTGKLENWESVAPGGFPFCGPATGRQARQVPPNTRADAAFKFDMKATRPFSGKDWNKPGVYRLLVQYYLLCPNNTLSISACEDRHLAESDYFRIAALPGGTATPGPAGTPASPAPGPSPTPARTP